MTAIIREIPDSKSADKKSKQILEIWKDNSLHNSVDLQLFDKHGKVYTDGKLNSLFCLLIKLMWLLFLKQGTFGCLEFSPDEQHLLYLAEKKEPKKQSFLQFGVKPSSEGLKVV